MKGTNEDWWTERMSKLALASSSTIKSKEQTKTGGLNACQSWLLASPSTIKSKEQTKTGGLNVCQSLLLASLSTIIIIKGKDEDWWTGSLPLVVWRFPTTYM